MDKYEKVIQDLKDEYTKAEVSLIKFPFIDYTVKHTRIALLRFILCKHITNDQWYDFKNKVEKAKILAGLDKKPSLSIV